MPSMILMFGSHPLGVLSSVRKYVTCVVMSGPLILIGATPLYLGGSLRDDFTVPIVAVQVLGCVKARNLPFCHI